MARPKLRARPVIPTLMHRTGSRTLLVRWACSGKCGKRAGRARGARRPPDTTARLKAGHDVWVAYPPTQPQRRKHTGTPAPHKKACTGETRCMGRCREARLSRPITILPPPSLTEGWVCTVTTPSASQPRPPNTQPQPGSPRHRTRQHVERSYRCYQVSEGAVGAEEERRGTGVGGEGGGAHTSQPLTLRCPPPNPGHPHPQLVSATQRGLGPIPDAHSHCNTV